MREAIEEAFWNFVDQKWRDTLNVAAAEPPSWCTGSGRGAPQEGDNRGGMAEAEKLAHASVNVTGLDGKRHRQGDSGRRCIFAEVMGCQGTHPPWHCKAFRKIQAKEREKIIEDSQLCPFCLLHDKARPCGQSRGQSTLRATSQTERANTYGSCTSSSRTCSRRKIRSTWCKEMTNGRSPRKRGVWTEEGKR